MKVDGWKRRVGATAMSLCLAASLMPATAIAEETEAIEAQTEEAAAPEYVKEIAEYRGGTVTEDVGDIDGTSTGQRGVSVEAAMNSSATVNVGDVQAKDSGVENGAAIGSTTDVTAGNVSVTSDIDSVTGEPTGVYNYSAGNKSSATTTVRDVSFTSTVNNGAAAAVRTSNQGDSNNSLTARTVTSDASGVLVTCIEDGASSVNVEDSVKAKETGVTIVQRGENSSIDVNVANTISGDKCGVGINASDPSTIKLTTWKIESSEGEIVSAKQFKEVPLESGATQSELVDVTEDFAKTINYIIKLEQPKEGGAIAATNALGEAIETAHEGEKVLLKVELKDGYKLLAAYNGEGKEQKLVAVDGKYYVEVPRGGGVYLSVELEGAPAPAPEQIPDSIPNSQPAPVLESALALEPAPTLESALALEPALWRETVAGPTGNVNVDGSFSIDSDESGIHVAARNGSNSVGTQTITAKPGVGLKIKATVNEGSFHVKMIDSADKVVFDEDITKSTTKSVSVEGTVRVEVRANAADGTIDIA